MGDTLVRLLLIVLGVIFGMVTIGYLFIGSDSDLWVMVGIGLELALMIEGGGLIYKYINKLIHEGNGG